MPEATMTGGTRVSIDDVAELLEIGLGAVLDGKRIAIATSRSKATALSRLGAAPGRIRGLLYFTGWGSAPRPAAGVRVSQWTLELLANEGLTGAPDGAAVLTDTALLEAAEEVAGVLEGMRFPGFDMQSPQVLGSNWLMAEDGSTVVGHGVTMQIFYCPPSYESVEVPAPEPPGGTGFGGIA